MNRTRTISFLALFFVASVASASWYDDYEDGLAAAQAGNWPVVIQKMTAAINAKPKEGNKEKSYGTIFINYKPYYYRGIAYFNTGKHEQAIADLEKAMSPGSVDLGSIENWVQRAKLRLEQAAAQPQPQPQPVTPVPVPVTPTPQPTGPVIDAALRQRAQAAVNEARQKIQAASQRRANTADAMRQYTDANSRLASARSNDDLNAVIASAENASLMADTAPVPGIPATTTAVAATTTPKTVAAASDALSDEHSRLISALRLYFDGEFESAAVRFKALTADMPKNGYVWAFLGASQYSIYAFEADDKYKNEALKSFRRAKQLGLRSLSEKYFSRRIRRVYTSAAG